MLFPAARLKSNGPDCSGPFSFQAGVVLAASVSSHSRPDDSWRASGVSRMVLCPLVRNLRLTPDAHQHCTIRLRSLRRTTRRSKPSTTIIPSTKQTRGQESPIVRCSNNRLRHFKRESAPPVVSARELARRITTTDRGGRGRFETEVRIRQKNRGRDSRSRH